MRVHLGLVLITALICLAKLGATEKKEKAYVVLHKDAKAKAVNTHADAVDYCINEHKKHIAHLGQLERDHETRENPHTDCAWTYYRYHPMKLSCKGNKDPKDSNYCEDDDDIEYVKCSTPEGVYCNTLDLDTEKEYFVDKGELLTMKRIIDVNGIISVNSAKALCDTYGLRLAYADQATRQMDWYDYSSCKHCWLRQNHAYYSLNCQKMHEMDYWVQRPGNEKPTDCVYCYGIPKDPNPKLSIPCIDNTGLQSFNGKKVHCADTGAANKDGGILIMARYTCAEEQKQELEGKCQFSGRKTHHYIDGWGDPKAGYFMGLDKFHELTRVYRGGLMLQLWTDGDDLTADATKYCIWDFVDVGDENKEDKETRRQFVLKVSQTAKCQGIEDQFNKIPISQETGLPDPTKIINDSPFSTLERDNDKDLPASNDPKSDDPSDDCANIFKSGWWFNHCDVESNLFGVCELDEGKYDKLAHIERQWGNYKSEHMKMVKLIFTIDKKDNQNDQDSNSEGNEDE